MKRTWRFSISLLLALGISLQAAPERASCAPRSGTTPAKYALLIGCTEYPNLLEERGKEEYESSIRLWGPANDVALFRRLLVETFQFPATSVTALVGWPEEPERRPTRTNILRVLEELAGQTSPEDQVVILFAGHGSSQPVPPNRPPDEINLEPDGLDEIFLPADVRGWSPEQWTVENALLDDEIGQAVTRIRDTRARVWVIFDSCHSGTMLRGPEEGKRYRFLPSHLLGVPSRPDPQRPSWRGQNAGAEEDPERRRWRNQGIAAFYATLPEQLAPELPLPQGSPPEPEHYHGLLTYSLVSLLKSQPGPFSYRSLMDQLLARYQGLSWSHPTPFAEGDLDRQVLGLERWPRPLFQLRKSDGLLRVTGGALEGATQGSILAVYPPGSQRKEETCLGYLRVEEVELNRSRVSPVPYAGKATPEVADLPNGAPCEIVYRQLGEMRIQVGVAAPSLSGDPSTGSPTESLPADLTSFVAALKDACEPFVSLEPEAAHPPWTLFFDENGIQLLPASYFEAQEKAEAPCLALGPFPRAPTGRAVQELCRSLQGIYRHQNLLRLAASWLSPPDAGFRLDLVSCPEDSGACRPVPSGARLAAGERVKVRIENQGSRELDVTVLFLDAGFGVHSLFPRPTGSYNRLRPGSRPVELQLRINAETTGREHLFGLALPAEAGTPPLDLSWLSQPTAPLLGLRGEFSSPLHQLLLHAAFGIGSTRGMPLSEESAAVLRLISWETVKF